MTQTRQGRPDRRPDGQADRRPDWLQRKHARQPANPRLAAWADQMLQELYGRWDTAVPIGPFRTAQAAKNAKNALYDAAYKRWNRTHHDEPLSLSANVTDPADGKCYARGQCRCEQNGCKPTPGPGWHVHARLYDKRDGRAHQGAKPRDQWDYDPMASRQQRPAGTGSPEQGSAAATQLDPEPARVRRAPREQPPIRPAARKAPAVDETLVAKVMRWTR